MNPDKKDIIDYVFTHHHVRSFIDMGGAWGVDGAYTFYAIEKYRVQQATLVDFNFTQTLLKNQKKTPSLTLVKGDFGQEQTRNQLKKAEAMFMFDILLHQVNPNWTRILEMYAPLANYCLIFNPQFKASRTTRLVELGEEEYFKNVPHDKSAPSYSLLFEKPDEECLGRNRKWRDNPGAWQWGITNKDLINKMEGLGFSLEYLKCCGRFGNLPRFDNYAFMFQKV